MSEEKCETCRFFLNTGRLRGECRRFPPKMLIDEEQGYVAVFPDTPKSNWCGEYQQLTVRIPTPNVGS